MSNDLILYNDSLHKDDNLIIKYLYSGIETAKVSYVEDFTHCIKQLYKVPLFSCMLNAVITKIKHNSASFKLMPLNNWDRVLGHCKTATKEVKSQESIFKNGFFSKNYTIVIKKIKPTIIIHEVGHAIEHIANINVDGDFRKCISDDFKDNNSYSIQLKSAVKDVMQEQLKSYELEKTMVELFARFFEMLSMSKEVDGWKNYQFTFDEITTYFSNTFDWANNVLIPILKNKTDSDIESSSIIFVNSLKNYEKKWTDKFKSKFADSNNLKDLHNEKEKHIKETIDYFTKQNLSKLDDGTEYLDFGKKK